MILAMFMRRLTLGKVLLAGFVLCLVAGVALPPLDSRAPIQPAIKYTLIAGVATLLVALPVATVKYFKEAWQKLGAVPNKGSYALWVGLETTAALLAVMWVIYTVVHH